MNRIFAWIWRFFGAYDGASRDRPQGGWNPVSGRSAEEMDKPSRRILIDRARDLERNSDITEAAIGGIIRNSVGALGIIPQAHVTKANGEEDERRNDAIEMLWNEWTRKENCDVTGASTFAELQSLVLRRRIVDGEVFIRKLIFKGGRFPLKLQLFEPDQLDHWKTEHEGRKVYDGIEVDEYLKPVGYWFRHDPMDLTGNSVRVPAEEIIHLFRKQRITQIHGVSELALIMQRVKDSKEYIDAELMAARIAACFAIFIRKGAPGGYIGRMDKDAEGKPVQEIAPGMIQYLNVGEEPVSAKPDHPNTGAKEFLSLQQRLAGAGLGTSYEVTSRDLSQVSYSSARQGQLEDRKTFRVFQRYLVDHLCLPIWEAFVESIVLSGELKVPDFYGKRARYAAARWITPGWEWVDPLKEVRAANESLQIGASTLEEICGGKGLDWQEVLRQRAREQRYAESLGVKLGELPPQEISTEGKEE